MLIYYIVPLRKTVLPMEVATLRQVCDLIDSPRKTQVRIADLPAGKEEIDILVTSSVPPPDQGKFVLNGVRHVGRGVIMGHNWNESSGILDAEHMPAGPHKTVEFYAEAITF